MHAILKGMFTYTKTDIICAATLLLIITRIYGWKKKDIFMKLYFWITFSRFCLVAAFAAGNLADSGIINMCRGLRSLTWACAFIAFNYTIFFVTIKGFLQDYEKNNRNININIFNNLA